MYLDKDEKKIVPPADGNYSTLSPMWSYLNQLINIIESGELKVDENK
jgi:hypothetical protein